MNKKKLEHLKSMIDHLLTHYPDKVNDPALDRFYKVSLALTKSEMLFLKDILDSISFDD